MSKTTASGPSFSETADAVRDLFEQMTTLSLNLLGSVSASSMAALNQAVSSSNLGDLVPRTGATSLGTSSCRIPPPCWAPQPIGDVACHVCPGGTATLRLRITNCGMARRNIRIAATGGQVTITPASVTLGPLERAAVTASVSAPADAAAGQEYEFVVWVLGCQNHFLRWSVKVATRGASCCHEVEVEDCPDLVHHWYDHFYCDRPCWPARQIDQ